MSDEWSRCPICFEDYSSIHRPTTFSCGHSTCIEHVTGFQQMRNCPICRHALRPGDEYHVSYNLEDAARFYQLIKDKIDLSTVDFSSISERNVTRDTTAEMIHRDEIFARRLQAELNRETRPVQSNTVQPPSRQNPTARVNRPTDTMKTCGHSCDLVSTDRCCTCLDRRPIAPDGRYETYIDGVGRVNRVPRNAFYCSTCKRR